jgi:formyl-CoA transferase
MTEATGPLAGLRILDLTTVLFGPFGAQTLGDWGAELIKVEGLTGDQWRYTGQFRNRGMSGQFMATNRNKRSVATSDRAGRRAGDEHPSRRSGEARLRL